MRTQQPLNKLLEFIGWDTNVVPELRDGFASRGKTTREAASKFGIPDGIPVSIGWSDAMCGMLALGVFTKPTSFIITGTSAIVGSSSATEPKDDQPLYLIPEGSAPYPVTFGPTQMSGGSILWAAQLFGVTEIVDDPEITCRGTAILADAMLTQSISHSTAKLSVSGEVHHPTAADLEYGLRNYRLFIEEQRALLTKKRES